jgi:hypothetical protein
LYVLTEPSPGAWINDLIVIITGVLWLLAASGADSFFAAITGLHLRILHLSHLYQAEIIFHGFQICIFFKNGAYSRFV